MADLGKDPQAIQKSLRAMEARMAGITGGGSPTVRLAGLVLVGAIKVELSKPGTGIVYGGARSRTTGRKRKSHQASAPGQPPAVDTGRLRNSVGMETVGGVLRVGVADVEAKAVSLEFGNLGEGGHIEKRPYMRPALAAAKDRMTGVVVKDLQRRPLV